MSPGPVTAAPDFGRHAAARMEIVGTQVRYFHGAHAQSRLTNFLFSPLQRRKSANIDPNVRHSFNGGDVQLDFSATTPTATNKSQFGVASEVPGGTSRMNGHVRSGSAGNWGAATRGHLTAYPLSSIPGGELKSNLPWAEPMSRVSENNWV